MIKATRPLFVDFVLWFKLRTAFAFGIIEFFKLPFIDCTRCIVKFINLTFSENLIKLINMSSLAKVWIIGNHQSIVLSFVGIDLRWVLFNIIKMVLKLNLNIFILITTIADLYFVVLICPLHNLWNKNLLLLVLPYRLYQLTPMTICIDFGAYEHDKLLQVIHLLTVEWLLFVKVLTYLWCKPIVNGLLQIS